MLTVAFKLFAKSDAAKSRLGLEFSRNLGASWPAIRGVPAGGGAIFQVMNAQVRLLALDAGVASVNVAWADDIYLSTNNRNTLFWGQLPDFVPRD